jgi:hypothetical protein
MSKQQTAQAAAGSGSRFVTGLLVMMLLLAAPALRAAVNASLDRSTVYSGDTVTLSIETSGDDQGQRPDLAPLKKDFDILGTSSSQQIQIINGQRSDRSQWLIELAPRRTGALTVPALQVGSNRSQALDLQVSEPPVAANAQAGQPVFIQSEISPAAGDTYVQQQLLYTTRLYYRVPLIEGDFSDPELNNAAVERLGDDQQYQTTVNGQRYQVLERRYAIFPEHSGELAIAPTVFTGRMVSASAQGSSFGRMDTVLERMLGGNPFKDSFFAGTPFGDPGKRVHLRGNTVSLTIKPRPAAYQGRDWLPTQQLVLHDSWAESPPELHTGEPVTRTITLEAKGVEAAQLPDIHIAETDGLRVYPEQPVQTNRTDGDWVYGRSEQTFAFVATKPGRITLPRIQVDWWDSTRHKQQTAVLPAWEVVATGSGTPATSPPAAPTTADSATPPTTAADQAAAAAHAVQPAAEPADRPLSGHLWLLAAGGVILLALLALLAAHRLRRRRTALRPAAAVSAKPAEGPTANVQPARVRQARQALRSACAANNPQAAARALLDWAAASWPEQPPRSLGALAGRVSRQGSELIRDLETVLYAPGTRPWVGEPLWQALADGLPATSASAGKHQPVDAPPLYPDWTPKAG